MQLNSELSVIEVVGADATVFLQGQLTNDIRKLADSFRSSISLQNPVILAAHLNNKGRMLATFLVAMVDNDHYYLITAKEQAQMIATRLKMFVLRAKVVLSVLAVDIYYCESDQLLQMLDSKPVDDNVKLDVIDLSLIGIKQSPYSMVVTSGISSGAINDLLNAKAMPQWHEFLIQSHIPMIYPVTIEKFIPQHVSFDLLNGISFNKGCYTGQEIVARTHYLGKVKRRLYLFQIIADKAIMIGDSLFSPLMNNQEVGLVVDTAKDASGKTIGLISAQSDCIEQVFFDQDEYLSPSLIKAI